MCCATGAIDPGRKILPPAGWNYCCLIKLVLTIIFFSWAATPAGAEIRCGTKSPVRDMALPITKLYQFPTVEAA